MTRIITAVDSILDKSGSARGAKKLNEPRQRDAQAHSADHQLKNVHFLKNRECGSLPEIEQPERR
jgi:hypothetical protein